MKRAVGIDFGTTNSAIAVATPNGAGGAGSVAELATFEYDDASYEVFRSVLFFEQPTTGIVTPGALAGPEAIDDYLSGVEGRLVQSLKTFLASESLPQTNIFNRVYSLEQLVSFFLLSLRRKAEETVGPLGHTAVVGRPVKYASAGRGTSETLALSRMRTALAGAGFTDVTFEYEPVGAAYVYEADMTRDQTVLVADFGGGTSDFCLMEIGPSTEGRARILGTDGAPIAGDTFDARIVRRVVAPELGWQSRYRASNKWMNMPQWLYSHLEQWHHLSFLKDRKSMALLLDLANAAESPEKMHAFLHLIRNDLGFHLHQAVQTTKVELSDEGSARLVLENDPIHIDVEVTRADFESWIADDLATISEAVDRVLAKTGRTAASVDHVLMTGGTSFVPAVRQIFTKRFGAERVLTSSAFTSVASGLAKRALD